MCFVVVVTVGTTAAVVTVVAGIIAGYVTWKSRLRWYTSAEGWSVV